MRDSGLLLKNYLLEIFRLKCKAKGWILRVGNCWISIWKNFMYH